MVVGVVYAVVGVAGAWFRGFFFFFPLLDLLSRGLARPFLAEPSPVQRGLLGPPIGPQEMKGPGIWARSGVIDHTRSYANAIYKTLAFMGYSLFFFSF